MTERLDVEFDAEGGVTLGAWLYLPGGPGPHAAITMAHGFAGVREHGLERFARAFADDGFVVLLHDHRGFGSSGGEPRQDVDPWSQIADWRRAISFLESRPDVDPKRIGLWGTSYAGGHAIVLGATDRRLRCVVAQVPTISGYEQGLRRVAPDAVAALDETFAEDDRAQFRGEPARYQAIVCADPAVPASYRAPEAIAFYSQPVPEGIWRNEVTVRSTRAARMYEPGAWIARVSPTPLLMWSRSTTRSPSARWRSPRTSARSSPSGSNSSPAATSTPTSPGSPRPAVPRAPGSARTCRESAGPLRP